MESKGHTAQSLVEQAYDLLADANFYHFHTSVFLVYSASIIVLVRGNNITLSLSSPSFRVP